MIQLFTWESWSEHQHPGGKNEGIGQDMETDFMTVNERWMFTAVVTLLMCVELMLINNIYLYFLLLYTLGIAVFVLYSERKKIHIQLVKKKKSQKISAFKLTSHNLQ